MELKAVSIDSNERIFLDGEEIKASTIKDHLRKAADQLMSPEDVETYREIADQKESEDP